MEVSQANLNSGYKSEFFEAQPTRLLFTVPPNGSHTPNSLNPRSELRQILPNNVPAAWTAVDGKHTMTVVHSVDNVTSVAIPSVIVAQIHSASAYVVIVKLVGSVMHVSVNGNNIGVVNSDYKIGTRFTTKIVSDSGTVTITHSPVGGVPVSVSASIANDVGLYFKAGCYAQTTGGTGFYRVSIYSLIIS